MSNQFSVLHEIAEGKVAIWIYDFPKKEPIKIITKYNYRDDWFNKLQYFTNEKIALVKSDRIALYNIKSGEFETELKRDSQSPYLITEKFILYFKDEELLILN